ncbi:site-2 protease family protein [Candidatus Saccharibacteria bacterium]|nr:site-2 protease family protein [Candidatus Saccharibacteria bacterium]
MNIFVGVIVGLVVLTILVILHEAGHFIAARRNGVNVLEFGIGFPPRAIAWIKDPKTHKWRKLAKSEWDKVGIMKTVIESGEVGEAREAKHKTTNVETKSGKPKLIADGLVFSINWLPIGGFCQMDGESATDTRPGTFGKANFWQKTKILFAGVAMNWLTAWVIFTILAWTGMPYFLDNQFTVGADTRTEQVPVRVVEVMEGSPAEAAGILAGDYIVDAGGEVVTHGSDVTIYNNDHAGEEVTYKIYRKGEEGCNCDENLELTAKLNGKDAEYLLGVTMESSQALSYSTWSAPITGAGLTLQITGETFKGVGELVWNLITGTGRLFSFDEATRESGQEAISAVGDSVSGPVGIIGVLFPSFTAAGPSNLAFLAALISVSLACMNVLPIPALDGGRWLLIGIYKLRRKPLTKETEQKIVSRAMFVLLALMAVVTILDITRFF